MSDLLMKLSCIVALLFPLAAFGADAPQQETGQKATIEFFRSSDNFALPTTRIDVNGQRLEEIGKDGTTRLLVDPGLTLVTMDAALTPGKFKFLFTAEKGVEYRFEIFNSMGKQDEDHLFGVPPKVANGKVVESGGTVKAALFSVKQPKAVEPEAAPIKPAKAEPAQDAAASAVKAPLSVEERLRALKRLYEQELISKELYLEKQQKILEELK